MKQEDKHTLLGILSISIPIFIGSLILAPDIKTIFDSPVDQIYIYYQWNDKYYKIHISEYKEFEADVRSVKNVPYAKMCITVDGRHYLVPLDRIDEFMEYYPNAKLSVLDENHDVIPELSIHRVPGY